MIDQKQLDLWFQTERILAGTGHRPEKLGGEYDLIGPWSDYLRSQLSTFFDLLKPSTVISGMALGFDQLLAIAAIERKIPVLAAVPCETQEKMWPQKSKDHYYRLLKNPQVTVEIVTRGKYHPGMMQVRNEYMCDHATGLIAAWDGTSGGTCNCIKYARKTGMNIFYINLDSLREKPIQNQKLF